MEAHMTSDCQLSVRIPHDLAALIERTADEERRTISSLIRNVLIDWAEDQKSRGRPHKPATSRKPIPRRDQSAAA
jgi:uncharacterized protein (DUF1778 family)